MTEKRENNLRSWLYRIAPSVLHGRFEKSEIFDQFKLQDPDPNQKHWNPFALPSENVNFVQGLKTLAGSGPDFRNGLAVHIYACNASMIHEAIYNSDGDFLIVPQEGELAITTEFGKMTVAPNEICVLQKGIKFAVAITGPSRGYVCEVYDNHFRLPELGPIGANGLANPRDFSTPVAWYEETKTAFKIYNKFQGNLFVCNMVRTFIKAKL